MRIVVHGTKFNVDAFPGSENTLVSLVAVSYTHLHSEFTQINWNGVLGEIKLVAVDPVYVDDMQDRKSTRLNSSHVKRSRMPSSA